MPSDREVKQPESTQELNKCGGETATATSQPHELEPSTSVLVALDVAKESSLLPGGFKKGRNAGEGEEPRKTKRG